jgi:hypothetical protein
MTNGSRDFDFVHGHWLIHNRKLRDNTDPACEEWVEFEATGHAAPILRGSGNVDQMFVPDPPDGDSFEGFTLRIFDPAARTWRIWWSSTRAAGKLDPPVVGRFTDGHGIFECDDVIGGHSVRVRFEWFADASAPTWQQSFSYDEGATWKLNWVMSFSRATDADTPIVEHTFE